VILGKTGYLDQQTKYFKVPVFVLEENKQILWDIEKKGVIYNIKTTPHLDNIYFFQVYV
jgi:hypothetical protein